SSHSPAPDRARAHHPQHGYTPPDESWRIPAVCDSPYSPDSRPAHRNAWTREVLPADRAWNDSWYKIHPWRVPLLHQIPPLSARYPAMHPSTGYRSRLSASLSSVILLIIIVVIFIIFRGFLGVRLKLIMIFELRFT